MFTIAMVVGLALGPATAASANHVEPIWPCAYFKPHTGDTLGYYFVANDNLLVEEWNCSADHLGQYTHIYHVTYNKVGNYYTWGGGWV